MKTSKALSALSALLLVACAPVFSQSSAKSAPDRLIAPQKETLVLPIGTIVPIRVLASLSTAAPSPTFHATLASDIQAAGMVAIPRGTPVIGSLIESRQGARAQITLRLTRIDYKGHHLVVSTDTLASSHDHQVRIASGTLMDFALQSPLTVAVTRPAGSISPLPPVHTHPQ
jgi:hypothetical protein